MRWNRIFGLAAALHGYTRRDLASDGIAGLITAILLVPQGIAFAMLAGLPPQTGLYASILPMIVYALFGSSRTLSVGPVSVAAIMVASALATPEMKNEGNQIGTAAMLALEGGLFLMAFSALRLGSLVNLISNPVLSGFSSGAAILIMLSQFPHLIGAPAANQRAALAALREVPNYFTQINSITLAIGLGSVIALIWLNRPLAKWLQRVGIRGEMATALSRLGPLVVVIVSAVAVVVFNLSASHHIDIVGHVPSGLPSLSSNFIQTDNWLALTPSALFIALIGYVESIAIAKTLAARHHETVHANRELFALGGANIAAAFSGTMPVAGGFSRTMVNHAAGARTQIAAVVTAFIIALAVAYFAGWFVNIPKAALAAIIIFAIMPLVSFKTMSTVLHADLLDGLILLATFFGVLLWGIEEGLTLGIGLSLLARWWRGSRRDTTTAAIDVQGKATETVPNGVNRDSM